jgi:hypothetical protein
MWADKMWADKMWADNACLRSVFPSYKLKITDCVDLKGLYMVESFCVGRGVNPNAITHFAPS